MIKNQLPNYHQIFAVRRHSSGGAERLVRKAGSKGGSYEASQTRVSDHDPTRKAS